MGTPFKKTSILPGGAPPQAPTKNVPRRVGEQGPRQPQKAEARLGQGPRWQPRPARGGGRGWRAVAARHRRQLPHLQHHAAAPLRGQHPVRPGGAGPGLHTQQGPLQEHPREPDVDDVSSFVCIAVPHPGLI